ncbi:MAG: hypothetical protein ABDH28_00095 [Brevinematia bacterium]
MIKVAVGEIKNENDDRFAETFLYFRGINELSVAYSVLEFIPKTKKYEIKIGKNKFVIKEEFGFKDEYPVYTKIIASCILFGEKVMFKLSDEFSVIFYQDNGIKVKVKTTGKNKPQTVKTLKEIAKDLLDDVWNWLEQSFHVYRN